MRKSSEIRKKRKKLKKSVKKRKKQKKVQKIKTIKAKTRHKQPKKCHTFHGKEFHF